MMMKEKLIEESKIWRNSELNMGVQFETNYESGSEYDLKEAIEEIENIFLKEDIKIKLKSKLEKFLYEKKKLEQQLNLENLFLNEKPIFSYLETYYELLSMFMSYDKILFKDESLLAILNNILYYGYDQKRREFSVYSPFVLNLVYKLKKLFKQYGALIEKAETNKVLESIYFHDVLNYAQENWGYSICDEKQCKLFVIPNIRICDNNLKLSFNVNYISEIDSFKVLGSGEIAEKVVHELNVFLEDEKNIYSHNEEIEFKVAILGNFENKYLKQEFGFYFKEIQRNINSSKIHIFIEYYANNPVENMETKICLTSNIVISFHYCDELHHTLKNPKQLEEIIESHQVVIFADCAEIYCIRPEFNLYEDTIKQFLVFGVFFEQCSKNRNLLDLLYINMVIATTFCKEDLQAKYGQDIIDRIYLSPAPKYGEDKVTLSPNIVNFCVNVISKNYPLKKFSTIYISTSKVYPGENTEFYEKELLDYCSMPEIKCLRITNKFSNDMEFPASNQYGKYIAINMWQLIKIFGLETLSEFYDKYVYLDYSNFLEYKHIKLLYEEKDRVYAETLIFPILKSIFEEQSGTFISNRFKWHLFYLLYRNSQSVTDLYFVYIFFDNLKYVDIKLGEPSENLKREISYSNSFEKYFCIKYLNKNDSEKFYTIVERTTASKFVHACEQIGDNNSSFYSVMKKKANS